MSFFFPILQHLSAIFSLSLSFSHGNSTLCFVLVFPLHAIKVFTPYFLISKLFLTRRLCNLSQPKVASLWYFLNACTFYLKGSHGRSVVPQKLIEKKYGPLSIKMSSIILSPFTGRFVDNDQKLRFLVLKIYLRKRKKKDTCAAVEYLQLLYHCC